MIYQIPIASQQGGCDVEGALKTTVDVLSTLRGRSEVPRPHLESMATRECPGNVATKWIYSGRSEVPSPRKIHLEIVATTRGQTFLGVTVTSESGQAGVRQGEV